MAEMKVDSFVVAIIIFSLFILVGTLILGDVNLNYSYDPAFRNITMNATGTSNYSMLDQATTMIEEMKNNTFESNLKEDDISNSMFKGSILGLRTVKNSFGMVLGSITSIGQQFSIPTVITTAFYIIIIILLIAAVWKWIGGNR